MGQLARSPTAADPSVGAHPLFVEPCDAFGIAGWDLVDRDSPCGDPDWVAEGDGFGEVGERNTIYYVKSFWSKERLGLNLTYGFIEDDVEIPPFIEPIESFGHTHFSYSYKINLNNQNYFITGDAVSNRLAIKSEIGDNISEPHMDLEKYFSSINYFKNQNGIIVPGHDKPFNISDRSAIRTNVFNI